MNARQISSLSVCIALGVACDARQTTNNPRPEPTLEGAVGSDDPGSCATCHPRQFREWAGSSHNYGGGIDPVYQTLEITANYYQKHRSGRPAVRQNLFCISCHQPSATGYVDGRSNPNLTFRPPNPDNPPKREIARPTNDEDLLAPAGRATELAEDGMLDAAALAAQRRLTFQGITCDSCHKVGAPFNDLVDEDAGQVCREETPECAARLRAQCEMADDPRCRRISRGGHPHAADRFEPGISNLAIVYERDGNVRYGPFGADDIVAANPAHGVDNGATPAARAMLVSFPGQPEDRRPYLETGQFCGACHDVRLPPPDDPSTPEVEMEPIYEEPFIRLENLYTEWFTSPLNLHPDSDPRDNPYLDEAGAPRRIVCQDCHMSLFPYAPPGTYPGEYTAKEDIDCDELGRCGEQIALERVDGKPTTHAGLRVQHRPRVTTHNMSGVDIGLGRLDVARDSLGLSEAGPLPVSLALPNQTLNPDVDQDQDYGLPMSLDARRRQLLRYSATISLAGTPEFLDPSDRDCSDGACCTEDGHCNLPIKAWLTNVNGGHNVAAGFSQERQIWVELTVQDLGRTDPATGLAPVVDCALVGLDDLYGAETSNANRYPRFANPKAHDAESATELMNRLFGVATGTTTSDHELVCRGLSGHVMDKPHHETGEAIADGRLGDEDLWLHRIGNSLPELEDGGHLSSWHVVDFGLGANLAGAPDSMRVGRPDQFHVPGNDAFGCNLSQLEPDPTLAALPATLLDPASGTTSTVSLAGAGRLRWRVTDTSDERLEILYPFPEFRPLLPRIDSGGALTPGERFGLVYPTNIFYRVCGCPRADGESCEGPEDIGPLADGPAQMPWVTTFPVLPHLQSDVDDNRFHFAGPKDAYDTLMTRLGLEGGTPAAEAFTFIPLNANHMPNNRALAFYKPQRHYWDIRVDRAEVVGPIRVSVKLWYRHFPPEFLRLMARAATNAYARAEALGQAAALFPNGPLVVEGAEASRRWPDVGNVDRLERVLMDEAVFFVVVRPEQAQSGPAALPNEPTYAEHIRPIFEDHCLPCHSDVLRHGGLVLGYDAFAAWDDPARGPGVHKAQDVRANLVDRPSRFVADRVLVRPGDPRGSFLLTALTEAEPDPASGRVRRMPMKQDALSRREIETLRRWIELGAP